MAEQAEAPQGLAACSTFYFTVILIFFDLEPDFTVMVAVPFFFGFYHTLFRNGCHLLIGSGIGYLLQGGDRADDWL